MNPISSFKKVYQSWSKFERVVVFPLYMAIVSIALIFGILGSVLGYAVGIIVLSVAFFEMRKASKKVTVPK